MSEAGWSLIRHSFVTVQATGETGWLLRPAELERIPSKGSNPVLLLFSDGRQQFYGVEEIRLGSSANLEFLRKLYALGTQIGTNRVVR